MNAIIPAWMKVIGPLALLAVFGIGCAWMGSNHTGKQWQAKWSQRDAADAQAAQAFNQQQRRIELQRQGAIDGIQQQAEKDIAKAQRDASITAAESERMQHGIKAAIARLNTGGSIASTTTSSKARDRTGLLLAELYGEIDTAAGRYAAEADRRRVAGLTCERAYDAIRASELSEKKSSKNDKHQ